MDKIKLCLMKELNNRQYSEAVMLYANSWASVLYKEHGISDNVRLWEIVRNEFDLRNHYAPGTQIIALEKNKTIGSISGLCLNESWLLEQSKKPRSYSLITANGNFYTNDPDGDSLVCVAIQINPGMRGRNIGSLIIESIKSGLSHNQGYSGNTIMSEKVVCSLNQMSNRIDRIYPYTRLNGLKKFMGYHQRRGEYRTVSDYVKCLKNSRNLRNSKELEIIIKSDATYFHYMNGARQKKVCPRGRPEDFDSLGFNNLVYYKVRKK